MTERLAILTRQIGHYHNARYKGAAAEVDQITVISTAGQGEFKEFLAKDRGGYDVIDLFTSRSHYNQAVKDGGLTRALEKALSDVQPTVIAIAGWANPESMAAIRWAKSHTIPLVMMSESQVDDAPRNRVQEVVKRKIVTLCDAALVGGSTHSDYIQSLGMPAKKIAFGYNAIDNDHFWQNAEIARNSDAQNRERLSLPDRYIIASGRFIPKKNFPALIEAYSQAIANSVTSPELVILGDGAEKPKILQAIEDYDVVNRVHLVGYKTYDELPALYGLSEGFVHVSTSEQWGLVINEAMSAGVPVIASSKCGATRTLMTNGKDGFTTEPDPLSISKALEKLMALNDTERKKMGLAARQAVANWGPARFGAGMRSAIDFATQSRTSKKLTWLDKSLLARLEQRVIQQVA